MEKEKLESLLIDYIDNRLNSVDRRMVEQELVNNPGAYKLYEELKEVMHQMDQVSRLEPSTRVKASFEKMLAEEMAEARKGRSVWMQPWFYRAAAAVALLIIGGGIGYLINRQNNEKIEQLAQVVKQQQEQLALTQKMMGMIANDQSASQRIQGVNVALTLEKPDDKIVEVLVKTMNEDPNSNVRLAALEALSQFIDEKQVRAALVESLTKQKDPVVQITLIQMLVRIKEKGVVDDLQKIVDDESSIQAVKDEAYSGILKLS